MKPLLVAIIVNIFALGVVQGEIFTAKAIRKLEHQHQLGSEGRIYGGKVATLGQFPWQALVISKSPYGDFHCGGSLISDEWVLTAAQCILEVSEFSIRLGTTYSSGKNENSLQIISSNYAIHHEKYNPFNFTSDIALIKLSRKADLNQYVRPIELDSNVIPAESNLTLSGFGAVETGGPISSRLHYVTVSSITNQECYDGYGNIVTNSIICTLGLTVEGPCSGDGGGPLIRYANGSARQVGIFIFQSAAGCDVGHPAGYTRTEPYREWIKSKTGL